MSATNRHRSARPVGGSYGANLHTFVSQISERAVVGSQVCYKGDLPDDVVLNVVESYRFELHSRWKINFAVTPINEEHGLNEEAESLVGVGYYPGNLLVGHGLAEACKLYNDAVNTTDLEIRLLLFTKAIEYVSQTVVRQSPIMEIREHLRNQTGTEPDSRFVIEPIDLVQKYLGAV